MERGICTTSKSRCLLFGTLTAFIPCIHIRSKSYAYEIDQLQDDEARKATADCNQKELSDSSDEEIL